jgi:hypothetical protein
MPAVIDTILSDILRLGNAPITEKTAPALKVLNGKVLDFADSLVAIGEASLMNSWNFVPETMGANGRMTEGSRGGTRCETHGELPPRRSSVDVKIHDNSPGASRRRGG